MAPSQHDRKLFTGTLRINQPSCFIPKDITLTLICDGSHFNWLPQCNKYIAFLNGIRLILFSIDLNLIKKHAETYDSISAFAPLLRLSPPPTDKDYYFNLDDNEGACDLFDVPLLTM